MTTLSGKPPRNPGRVTAQVMDIYSSSCLTKLTGHGKARHSQTVKKVIGGLNFHIACSLKMAGLLKKPLKLALVQLASGTLVGNPTPTSLNGSADRNFLAL